MTFHELVEYAKDCIFSILQYHSSAARQMAKSEWVTVDIAKILIEKVKKQRNHSLMEK